MSFERNYFFLLLLKLIAFHNSFNKIKLTIFANLHNKYIAQ